MAEGAMNAHGGHAQARPRFNGVLEFKGLKRDCLKRLVLFSLELEPNEVRFLEDRVECI